MADYCHHGYPMGDGLCDVCDAKACSRCGAAIDGPVRAPSGSLMPYCASCNSTRFNEARETEKRLGVRAIYYEGEMNQMLDDDTWG